MTGVIALILWTVLSFVFGALWAADCRLRIGTGPVRRGVRRAYGQE